MLIPNGVPLGFVGWAMARFAPCPPSQCVNVVGMVGTLRFVVLSQKVARFDVENQLFEEIQV
jgi:hypothetical protein